MDERSFDVIVVGGGPAGEVAAGRLADAGEQRVALVERELVGGECSFYACMPSKSLLRPAAALREVRRIPGAAEAVSGELDAGAVLARRDEVIHKLDDSSQLPWLRERGIALFRGQASLDGERRVRVGEDVLVADVAVILAVGSGPLFPPIPGLAEAAAWSNREITTAREAPRRLIVLGGGVVGVEMAQAWSSLGSRVTIVEAVDRLLSREEPFVSELVQSSLEDSGVTVNVGVKADRVERSGGELGLWLSDGRRCTGDRLLVAIGRTPRTAGLGLATVGLSEEGYLDVDDHLQIPGRPWLYAVGDVNGRSLLTHSGKYQARVAADHILGRDARAFADRDGRAPRVVFTDPEVAAVGLTTAQAEEMGIPVVAIDVDSGATAGASFHGRGAAGATRFVVDREREVLVGATFTGPDVAEFLQAASIATVAEVPLGRLAHAVAPFPTRSEVWLRFLEAYERRRGYSVHADGR